MAHEGESAPVAELSHTDFAYAVLDHAHKHALSMRWRINFLRFLNNAPKYLLVVLGAAGALLNHLGHKDGVQIVAIMTTVVAFLEAKELGAACPLVTYTRDALKYFVEETRLQLIQCETKAGGVTEDFAKRIHTRYEQIRSELRAYL